MAYYKSLDRLLVAAGMLREGKTKAAAAELVRATEEPDFDDMTDGVDAQQQAELEEQQNPQEQQLSRALARTLRSRATAAEDDEAEEDEAEGGRQANQQQRQQRQQGEQAGAKGRRRAATAAEEDDLSDDMVDDDENDPTFRFRDADQQMESAAAKRLNRNLKARS